jgi:hypothetical protein
VNFFDTEHQESPTSDSFFGVCDDQNGQKSYTDRSDKSKWIATVINEKPFQLVFTVIDKGVIKDDELPGRERCEGMLTSNEHIYFLELKVQRSGGIAKAKCQLESTIDIFNEVHPGKLETYTHRKAFVCNKRHPKFHVINNEEQKAFFDTYKVRFDINTEVKFKRG